jgi:hypothetical protein
MEGGSKVAVFDVRSALILALCILVVAEFLNHEVPAYRLPPSPGDLTSWFFDSGEGVMLTHWARPVQVPLVGAFPAGHVLGVGAASIVAVSTAQQTEQAHALLTALLLERRLVELAEGGPALPLERSVESVHLRSKDSLIIIYHRYRLYILSISKCELMDLRGERLFYNLIFKCPLTSLKIFSRAPSTRKNRTL